MINGEAVTEFPEHGLRLVQGDHEYVEAPEAVSTVEPPTQIEAGDDVSITGSGLTVTVTESVTELPEESVAVT